MSHQHQPLVSIVICNYNYGRFVAQAIESSLNQTYSPCEVIVVDDGSTDRSSEVIARYGDRIRAIFKKNGGHASAVNAGFAASSGEIIFLLDADDLFMPTKVAEIVEVLADYPERGWCFHPQKLVKCPDDSFEIALDELEIAQRKDSGEYDFRSYLKEQGKLNDYLPSWGLPATSALCFRRSLLEKFFPIPEAEAILISDNYIKYLALALAKGYALSKELSIQRLHDKNAYTQGVDREVEKAKEQRTTIAKADILTAYFLKEELPALSKFTNNIFALGLGSYYKLKLDEPQLWEIANQYLASLSWDERLLIKVKAFYFSR